MMMLVDVCGVRQNDGSRLRAESKEEEAPFYKTGKVRAYMCACVRVVFCVFLSISCVCPSFSGSFWMCFLFFFFFLFSSFSSHHYLLLLLCSLSLSLRVQGLDVTERSSAADVKKAMSTLERAFEKEKKEMEAFYAEKRRTLEGLLKKKENC